MMRTAAGIFVGGFVGWVVGTIIVAHRLAEVLDRAPMETSGDPLVDSLMVASAELARGIVAWAAPISAPAVKGMMIGGSLGGIVGAVGAVRDAAANIYGPRPAGRRPGGDR